MSPLAVSIRAVFIARLLGGAWRLPRPRSPRSLSPGRLPARAPACNLGGSSAFSGMRGLGPATSVETSSMRRLSLLAVLFLLAAAPALAGGGDAAARARGQERVAALPAGDAQAAY